MTYHLKLSDKVLIIVFIFTNILLILVKIFVGGSLEELIVLSNAVYFIAFVVTYIISRRFSKRVTSLTLKIEQMAAGDLSKRIKTKDKDEIGQLTNAINELMARLQSGIAIDVSKHKGINRAKTDFIALASHQLRTPLSIIKWYIDYLIAGDAGDVNPDQEKYLKEVYKSNERLIELVNALLDVSRIDLGTFVIEPKPTDIIERANTALVKFLPEINAKGIKLEKIFDKLPIINLDPRLTKMVFENIVSNAVKYTPRGGTVRISIQKTNENILIKISDTGCGIPREQQPKMFTKLFRADNVKKIESIGTGLGLYIVKAVIEKSGGKIWFESPSMELLLEKDQKKEEIPIDKRDGGTTFYITIPLAGMKKKKGTKKLENIG